MMANRAAWVMGIIRLNLGRRKADGHRDRGAAAPASTMAISD